MMTRLLLTVATIMATVPAFAEDGSGSSGWGPLAAGLAIGIAAFGGSLGQGKIGASAMEGIARNPQARGDMFIPMILGLVFVESLVIYAFAIAFLVK